MRTFFILWLGQLASSIGSSMTYFALTLWVWQQTQSATAIALILVFYQLPQVVISPISGVLADRLSRKHLLILSDSGAACCTISVGILAGFQLLQIWHLYLIAAIIGCFGNLQALTYATVVPLIVPKRHHTRANSMGAMVGYGAGILSPAFAGILYPMIGLLGITAIDMGTFAIAILTLFFLKISPNRKNPLITSKESKTKETKHTMWQEITVGFRYITSQPSLLVMVIALSSFMFLEQISETLYQPMILARTGGNTKTLGLVVAASGLGGVLGAIALSIWGGFRRRVVGMLVGFIGTGLSKFLFGLGRISSVWVPTQFGASLHHPLIFSSYMAIWYAKVPPNLQGRVFAADYLVGTLIGASASLSAGLLADNVFEPAMQSHQSFASHLEILVGAGEGNGMALLIVISSLGMLLIGIGGFVIRRLRDAELLIPDHDSIAEA
ncbi:MAG: MFS transporter [Cyanobacteria bacterium P01_E01_bin.6]